MRELDQLIERVQEIQHRLRHLKDSLPTAKGDREAIGRIETERAELHAELLAIGTEGMAQIDDPIVKNAVGKVLENLRAEANPDEPVPTDEPTPDPLEQARAVIDGHANEIGKTTGQMLDAILPMVEKSLNHHTTTDSDDENDHSGILVFALSVEMSETNYDEHSGMVGLAVSHLANFSGPDELYEVVQNDEAVAELARVLNYKLHALAIVTYGKGELHDTEDGEPRKMQCKVTTIVHPRGMVAYLRERIGNTYGEAQEPMVIVDDASDADQVRGIMDKHGRLPYALAYLYASTMKEIIKHTNDN